MLCQRCGKPARSDFKHYCPECERQMKALDKEGNAKRTMASLFDLPKGSENDYNVGCLFAACCALANVTGWQKAVTAEAWQKIGARSGYHVLTASDLKAVADGLRKWYVGGADYHNVTGLAADVTNYFNIKVQMSTGPVVAANWSTETGQEGTITADTPADLTLGSLANRTVEGGERLEVFYDETNTAVLPAGTIQITGRLV